MDLNLQFPALWEKAKEIKYSQCFSSPSPRDFVGFGPLTEPEALAIYNYSLTNLFHLMITYHTQGQEIYWQFQDYAPKIAYEIGQKFSEVSDYTLSDVPYESSFAGLKDWFLQEYQKPAYTIEAGLGENPLPLSQFDKIYQDNIRHIAIGTHTINAKKLPKIDLFDNFSLYYFSSSIFYEKIFLQILSTFSKILLPYWQFLFLLLLDIIHT